MLTSVLIVLHVLVALAIIGLVLLQHGKGADMGSGFGGGASGSLFGATGSANFLSRTTAVLAAVFFALSLALASIAAALAGWFAWRITRTFAAGVLTTLLFLAHPALPYSLVAWITNQMHGLEIVVVLAALPSAPLPILVGISPTGWTTNL